MEEKDVCTLPAMTRACSERACKHCGWNRKEQQRRKTRRAVLGLTRGKKGLMGLHLPKADADE